ncbi:MAG: threonine synthase [Coriobacteriaceae bacterium]|jgi:threonine synthase|nr:threonine synthase [Coriobacteriaceae bacterium]
MTQVFYIDTRGHCTEPVPFTEALVQGLAPGGGLFVPVSLPHLNLDEIAALAKLPYAARAAAIYQAFGVDLEPEAVDGLMAQAYGSNFDDPDICPITSLDANTHVLELWHGPTSAFKDMALQCLPRFFSASTRQLRARGLPVPEFCVLVATSGDTGKAALEGFKDMPGVSIGVLFPQDGVSDIQYKQMATQSGSNVMVWGVEGNFDDCQTGVKAVFADRAFNERLEREANVALTSANSINWGRLLPQVVYYVSSYASLVAQGKIACGEAIDVCVPTGNFGNILAAWYAKRIGTPLDMLMCASNENRVLTDFINTGRYDISQRQFLLTPSPSMDILVSSNLERQLFELNGRDAMAIRTWMEDLRDGGQFRVDVDTFAALRRHFVADSVSNADCLATIRQAFEKHRYLLDPHTAVAYRVAERLRGQNPVLIAATAHWAKFGDSVYRALHGMEPNESLPENIRSLSGCGLNRLISTETQCYNIPQGLARLDGLDLRFTDVIKKPAESIEEAVLQFLGIGG